MAKKSPFSNPAFKQKNTAHVGFNLLPNTTNFNSVFDVKPLEESDSSFIENLLIDGSSPENTTKHRVRDDIDSIKQITAEIKAIGRQAILLMGERICQARDILKSYENGIFTKWLEAAFGSKKSGYNMLTYYDFYSALPNQDLKEKFRQLPQKAAYILASRQGDMKKKEEIVQNYSQQQCTNFISTIYEKLPIQENDKRSHKENDLGRINKLKDELKILFERKKNISQEGRGVLRELRELIDVILAPNSKNGKLRK